MTTRIALIMAGGGGSRLWPASTREQPKQFLDPLVRTPEVSLLRDCFLRVLHVTTRENIYVVTLNEHAPAVRAILPELSPAQIIGEPEGRNTAPCVALALRVLRGRLRGDFAESTLMILPADQHIAIPEVFERTLEQACEVAESTERVVVLGVKPDRPHTGYGYIEVGAQLQEKAWEVKRFIEKPGEAAAIEFVNAGRYLWNAGVFVALAGRFAREFAAHCAPSWEALAPAERISADLDTSEIAVIYSQLAREPIDHAVIEKLVDLAVVPLSSPWTDLGSWRAVYEALPKDLDHNAVATARAHALVNTRGSLVWSKDAEVAVIGVDNIAVICSGGRVLVCALDKAEAVRDIAKKLSSSR